MILMDAEQEAGGVQFFKRKKAIVQLLDRIYRIDWILFSPVNLLL